MAFGFLGTTGGGAVEAELVAKIVVNTDQATRAVGEAFAKVDRSLGTYTTNFKQFQQSIDAATSRVTAFGLTAGIFFTVKNAILATASSMVEVEKGLADINVILNLSSKNLKVFSDDLFRVATSTGQTFAIAAKAATEFSRQGLGIEETLKRTRDALNLSRLAGIDAGTAVTDLTAAINSFSNSVLDSTQLVSKFVAVDQRFAVSSGDLAEAIKRVGSTAQDAGVPLDDLIGIVTALQERTARGGAVIGNALKTIFTKVQNPGVLDQLETFGIKVRDLGTRHLLPTIDILENVSQAIASMGSSAEKFKVENLLGSLYQINQLKSLMEDLKKANSTSGQATGIAGGASNESLLRSEQLNQTLAAQLNRTQNNLKQTFSNAGQGMLSQNLQGVLGFGNAALEIINKPNQNQSQGEKMGAAIGAGLLKGVGDVIFGPLALTIGAALFAVTKTALKSVITAVGSFTPLQTELRKSLEMIQAQQAALQGQAGAVNNIVGANAGRLGQEREILGIIEAQNVAKAGVSGGIIGRGVTMPGSNPIPGMPIGRASVLGQMGVLTKKINSYYDMLGWSGEPSLVPQGMLQSVGAEAFRSNTINLGINPAQQRMAELRAQKTAIDEAMYNRDVSLRGSQRDKNNYIISGAVARRNALAADVQNRIDIFKYSPFPIGPDPDIMSGYKSPTFHEDLMSGSTGNSLLAANMNQRRINAMATDAGRPFGGGASRRQLAIEDPALFAQVNANRMSRLQMGAFTAGFISPILGNMAAEGVGSMMGEGQGSRAVKAGIAGFGNTIGMGATMGAITGGPGGAVIGTTIGLIMALTDVFKQMNTILPEVTARISKITERISRGEEIFTDVNKASEQAEGFISGRISPSTANKTNYKQSIQRITSRMSALKIPSDVQSKAVNDIMSGDPNKISWLRDVLNPGSLQTELSFESFLQQSESLNPNDSKDRDKMRDLLSRLTTGGGTPVMQSVAAQDLLKQNTFRQKLGMGQSLSGNYTGFSNLLGPATSSDTQRQALQSFMKLHPDVIEAMIGEGRSMPGLSLGQNPTFGLFNRKPGIKTDRDIDLERLIGLQASGGLNTRTEILAASAQGQHAGQFGIFQAGNQAALTRASMSMNPFQIETLRGSQLLQELQVQGGLSTEKLNASAGGSLLKNIQQLQGGLTSQTERERFIPITNAMSSAAQDITLGKAGGMSQFSTLLAGLQVGMQSDPTMFKKFSTELTGITGEFDRYQGSLNDLIKNQDELAKALGISTEVAKEMSLPQAKAALSLQGFKNTIADDRARLALFQSKGLLFSDQFASGKLTENINDVATGAISGKGVGKAMVGGFSNQLAFSVKDMYRDLIQGANDVGAALKSSFKDAFKSFLDGSQSAGNALRSLGLSFANKLLDIAAQGTTNMLFGGLQNLGSAAWSAYKSPATGATGGYVTGGSGIRDDVPAMLNEGDFVLRQSSVNKYGVNFLNRLAGGGVALNPSSPLSNFAMSDESSVQNRLRWQQESANLNAMISYQQALDAYNSAKTQRRLGALINLGVAGAGAGIGYGAQTWKANINATNAINAGSWLPANNSVTQYPYMRAAGGLIHGYTGGGPVDGVPALLTGGEYVVNRSAVSRLGVGFMHSLNRGDVPAYAAGGFVGESISTNTGGGGDNLNESIARLINSNEKLRSSMEKGGGDTKTGDSQSSQPMVGNISIDVSIDSSGNPKTNVQTQVSDNTKSDTSSADQGKKLGSAIQAAVLDTIIKETRNGGILEQNFQRRR